MRLTTSLGELAKFIINTINIRIIFIIGGICLIINYLDDVLAQDQMPCEISQDKYISFEDYLSEPSGVELKPIRPGDSIQKVPMDGPSYVEPETEPETEAPTEPEQDETEWPETMSYIYATEEEVYALACLIWLEGRGESIECQQAIASVVVNRYTTNMVKYTCLMDVIYEPDQFTPAKWISETTPTQVQIDAARTVITHGPNIPQYVTYFRSKHFHEWGDQVPYQLMGSTYFSYSAALKNRVEGTK